MFLKVNNGNVQSTCFYSPHVLFVTCKNSSCIIWWWSLAGSSASLDSSENEQIFKRFWLINNWITPCSKVIFEKLLVEQPFKKSPAFYGIRNFIFLFTNFPHWKQSWTVQIARLQGIISHCKTNIFLMKTFRVLPYRTCIFQQLKFTL
jgi:hypothetical protein